MQCECGVLFLNQTPANLGFPGSLQTRFLARPYHCAVIHPEGSEMRLGVLGTRLRMPGSDPRFWSWRAAIFATKEEIPRHDKLGCQSEAQYSVWTWIIDQDQGRRQSPVSWRVWRQSVSSSLVTAVTRVAGQAACVSQWMFPGNHLLTISHWLYWASCHLSFTASCAVFAQTSTCSPSLIVTPTPGWEMRRVLCLVVRVTMVWRPRVCPGPVTVSRNASSCHQGGLVSSRHYLEFSSWHPIMKADKCSGGDWDNWTQLVTAQRSWALCNQVRLGPCVWPRMMPTPQLALASNLGSSWRKTQNKTVITHNNSTGHNSTSFTR